MRVSLSASAGMGPSWLHPRFPIKSGLGRLAGRSQKRLRSEGGREAKLNLSGPCHSKVPSQAHCHCQA